MIPHEERASGADQAASVCHEEQMVIWSSEVAESLAMGGWLREHLSYEDKLDFYADLSHRIRDIVESAFALSASAPASGAERMTAGEGISLAALQAAHVARQAEWCPDQLPDLSFRGNELAGEAGETSEALILHAAEISKLAGRASNIVKKLERERHGWRGSRATKEDLASELADVIHCTVLCAITAGIEIDPAVVEKFNATSEKQGLSVFLPMPATPAPATPPGVPDSVRALLERARFNIDGMRNATHPVAKEIDAFLSTHPAGQSAGSGEEIDPEAEAAWNEALIASKPTSVSTRTGDEGTAVVPRLFDLDASDDAWEIWRERGHGHESFVQCINAYVAAASLVARPAAPEAQGAEVEPSELDITSAMIQAGRYAANLNDGTLARIYVAMRAVEWREAREPAPPSSGQGGR